MVFIALRSCITVTSVLKFPRLKRGSYEKKLFVCLFVLGLKVKGQKNIIIATSENFTISSAERRVSRKKNIRYCILGVPMDPDVLYIEDTHGSLGVVYWRYP